MVRAIEAGEELVTTGLVLEELLQGFAGPKDHARILDHVDAAELRNKCRRGGIQIGTIDALLAQLCLRHYLTMLTTDRDFCNISGYCALRVWNAPA